MAVNGTAAIPWRRLTLLEQLKACQEAWCPGAPWNREAAQSALCGTPAGCFLIVRDSATSQPSLLCLSAGHEAVLYYNITSTGTVFQLSESRLTFSDLAQLVLFYSLTRDVLAVRLSIPHWIYGVAEKNRALLSRLEPNTWLCTSPDHKTDEMTHSEPGNVMCSIQLTSTNGALCVINPLYLREHGDDWLTQSAPAAHCAKQPSEYRRDRRLSSSRKWSGAGVLTKRAISLDQEPAAGMGSSGLTRARSADSPPADPSSTTAASAPSGVVLRRPSRDSPSFAPDRDSMDSLPTSTPDSCRSSSSSLFELQQRGSPVPQSPHRVSWIEDGVWLPPPRLSSLLHLPSVELDSLSVSSIEEEPETQCPGPLHPSAHRLADKVIHRLSAVGQALGGLVSSKKRLLNRVKELSERRGGAFAEAVKAFVETTLRSGGADPDSGVTAGSSEFLQDVRSSLTSLRETLLDHPETQAVLDSITDLNDSEIDSLVELSIHKVALKPVAQHLYCCLLASKVKDGSLERLRSNIPVLENKGMEDLGGSAGVGVPDSVTLERIQNKWAEIHETYSPDKKVQILLKVCKTIYHSMSANASSGKVFGADDFLPCLTWVLLRSDVTTLQLDTDYMMELLDPTQLQGEGGYYLTTLYASLYYISSFKPRLAARQLSVEAQHSLNQWHRRRTLHCDQSRRRKHRQTIRRQTCRDRGPQDSETREESGNEGEPAAAGEGPKQTESTTEGPPESQEKEVIGGQRAEDDSQTSTQESDCDQQGVTLSEHEEDGRVLCPVEEEDRNH